MKFPQILWEKRKASDYLHAHWGWLFKMCLLVSWNVQNAQMFHVRHSEQQLSELMGQFIKEREGIPCFSTVVNHVGNEDARRTRKDRSLKTNKSARKFGNVVVGCAMHRFLGWTNEGEAFSTIYDSSDAFNSVGNSTPCRGPIPPAQLSPLRGNPDMSCR